MRLAETSHAPPDSRRDLCDIAAAVLDRRLRRDAAAPIALGLSGGGDSLALLIAASAWTRRRGRNLLVLTVDHRLQAASADWTRTCAAAAARFGARFEALAWEGPKPLAGRAAAARAARHRLMADAARAAGARVLLLGHTADDVAEAALMREEGSTTPSPREWTPSPAWPEGRGLFILRPLLGVRRSRIRDWLSARGETWIDDPSNDDPAQARARARARLSGQEISPPPLARPDAAPLALACAAEAGGALNLPRAALRAASPAAALGFTAGACLCAAGSARPPRGERLERLARRLRGDKGFVATLAGARIEADATTVRFMREAGEAARGGLAEIALPPGQMVVWDGRFEVAADRPGLRLRRLGGMAARLGPAHRRALAGVHAPARGALPAIVDEAGNVTCPTLSAVEGVRAGALGHDRLLAACGAVDREP